MFQDRRIMAVFCARGGYGSLRLLDKIQYDLIKENPKILVGYSDITALLMAVHVKTGLVTFHGPMVSGLATRDQGNWDSLHGLITSSQPLVLSFREGAVLLPGRARGPLLGGNLSLICHLLGTAFLPSLAGCIMFFEERGEALYRLDRMLTQLKLSGHLRQVSAVLAGQFEKCGDREGIDALLMDIFSDLDIPVVTDFPVGHGLRNQALPLGLVAELDTNRMTLSIAEACVRP